MILSLDQGTKLDKETIPSGYMYVHSPLASLSNDNNNGSGNITKKKNLHSFKLCRIYLDPLNLSNVRDFFSS